MNVSFSGDWCIESIGVMDPTSILAELKDDTATQCVMLDGQTLGRWDSAFMTFLLDLAQGCRDRQLSLEVAGMPAGVQSLFALAAAVPEREGARRSAPRVAWLAGVGEAAHNFWIDGRFLTHFVGEAALAGWALAAGKALWSYEIGEPIESSPAVAGGRVVVGGNDGGVYCFGEK